MQHTSTRVFTILLALTACRFTNAAAAAECSEFVENGPCQVVVDRKEPITPLPYRVKLGKKVAVSLVIPRSPLEKVTFEETVTRVVETDVLAAVAQKLADPLKLLTLKMGLRVNVRIPTTQPYSSFDPRNALTFKQWVLEMRQQDRCLPAFQQLCDRIDHATALQSEVQASLAKWKMEADKVVPAVQQVQKTAWSNPDHAATPDQAVLNSVNAILKLLGCDSLESRSGLLCSAVSMPAPACGDRDSPLVTCQLPGVSVATARAELQLVLGVLASAYTAGSAEYQDLSDELVSALANQNTMENDYSRLQAAQLELKILRDALKVLDGDSDFTPSVTKTITAKEKTSSSQIKIAAVDVVSKKTTALPAVAINWSRQPWEFTAGVWYSTLEKRSFSVVPVLENGTQVVINTVRQTVLRETTTDPNIVPGIFIHYRGFEWSKRVRRLAILGTLGVGSNNGATEFAVGPSFAIGNLMISPLLHFGRDLVLTDGLSVGDANPADITGFQKRKWVRRFGVGLSYRVPL